MSRSRDEDAGGLSDGVSDLRLRLLGDGCCGRVGGEGGIVEADRERVMRRGDLGVWIVVGVLAVDVCFLALFGGLAVSLLLPSLSLAKATSSPFACSSRSDSLGLASGLKGLVGLLGIFEVRFFACRNWFNFP